MQHDRIALPLILAFLLVLVVVAKILALAVIFWLVLNWARQRNPERLNSTAVG